MTTLDPAVLADRILEGTLDACTPGDLELLLSDAVDVWAVMEAAGRVRRHRFGNRVHLCSIVNAKEGGCPEDCGFCSQSKAHATHARPGKFIPTQAAVEASALAATRHASALGLVTATRGLSDGGPDLERMIEAVRAVREAGHTEAHGSFGFLSDEALDRLVEAGLTELNHNLETGRSYFSKIVTTHTYDERIDTIRRAKARGLRTCVGGIFGMGESVADRVELAVALRELDVDEVPLNFLVSIEGTRLAGAAPLPPMEMLRIIAGFRLFLPRQNIFIAAGRTHLGQALPLIFAAGASGMMVGDFLTTPNRTVEDDLRMLNDLGLVPLRCGDARPEQPSTAGPAAGRRLPVVA